MLHLDWTGRRVLVTGHTGFKGSWLALWLHQLGATVTGLSDAVPSEPSHFDVIGLGDLVDDVRGDIRDPSVVDDVVQRCRPEVILHLAAQSLVRYSYVHPVETFTTNVAGTLHVLDAARRNEVPAVVVATTDKCYDNREWPWGYREGDPLGGRDPYSASKAAAEMVIGSYRASFPGPTRIASIRAGNVIGPGDWSEDRLIPDAVRAATSAGELVVRNPASTRPWQDVLDCLSGYVLVAERLLGGDAVDQAWNIGPAPWEALSVGEVVGRFAESWGEGFSWRVESDGGPHEARLLALDATLARTELGWSPVRTVAETVDHLVGWHRLVHGGGDARAASIAAIASFDGAVR